MDKYVYAVIKDGSTDPMPLIFEKYSDALNNFQEEIDWLISMGIKINTGHAGKQIKDGDNLAADWDGGSMELRKVRVQ